MGRSTRAERSSRLCIGFKASLLGCSGHVDEDARLKWIDLTRKVIARTSIATILGWRLSIDEGRSGDDLTSDA
jgi:hypothetical protein